MTDLIPRDAAIAAVTALIDRANKQGLPSVAIIAMSCRQDICAIPAIDPAAIREAALWDLLEEIDAQIDLAEEISPEFADKVQLALWAGQTKGAAE